MRSNDLMRAAAALALCTGNALAADQAAYDAAHAAARAAIADASAVGGEWRDTRALLESAAAAAGAGDLETAVQLAEEAAFQGRMGAQQAREQAEVGNPGYLK